MIELAILLIFLPHSQNKCPGKELVCLVEEKNSLKVFNYSHEKINVIIKVEKIENIKVSIPYPSNYEIPPRSIKDIVQYEITDPNVEHHISYDWWWKKIE